LKYEWYRADGRQMVPGTKLRDLNRVLTIDNAPLEAEGDYVCKCTRGSGVSKTMTISLVLEGGCLYSARICLDVKCVRF